MKLPVEIYYQVKKVLNLYGGIWDENEPSYFSDEDELRDLNKALVGLRSDEKNKAQREYLKLLRFKPGDSFENHFQPEESEEEEKHYWKTKGGLYLCYYDGVLSSFLSTDNADRLTKSEVEASDFDINKLHIADEEFD